MLHFNLTLRSPWKWTGLQTRLSKDYVEFDRPITENKCVSLQVSRWNMDYPYIVGLSVRLSWRGEDHAGLFVDLTLLDHSVIVNLYDRRHWDDEADKWEVYPNV